MIADEGCWERGCACHDSRVDGPGIELVRKREWAGLTRDEIAEIAMQSGAYDEQLLAFARAIEAKLKEKNSD